MYGPELQNPSDRELVPQNVKLTNISMSTERLQFVQDRRAETAYTWERANKMRPFFPQPLSPKFPAVPERIARLHLRSLAPCQDSPVSASDVCHVRKRDSASKGDPF